MAELLLWILGFTIFGSIASLAGGAILLTRQDWTRRASTYFVSFAAGALLGAVFLEFLPEIASANSVTLYSYMLAGIIVFFIVENLLRWHHHHHGKEVHTFNYMITIGDAIHNFIDGVAIAAAFLLSVPAGIATAVAVFFHEIPQEIGDFAVLLRGGWSRMKVIGYNIVSAVTAVAGALIAFYWGGASELLSHSLIAFTAGVFLYIAGVDLLPEIHHSHGRQGRKGMRGHTSTVHMLGYAAALVLGIAVIYAVGLAFPE